MNAPTQEKWEVAVLQKPRLPYHDAINERFGIDRAGWKALTEAIFPNAQTVDSVIMALSYCRARKLDPFKRPVHIVPMWSSTQRKTVETVWPGVAELRTTAFRTSQFAGMDAAEFGPAKDEEFSGSHEFETKKGPQLVTRKVKVTFPEWCQVHVWRLVGNQRVMFAGPKVYWRETYAKWRSTLVPNEMWAKRPYGQLEKCAEAAALRRAFPEEIGNDLAAEEMEGQGVIEETAQPARIDGPARPKAPNPNAPDPHAESDIELVEAGHDDGSTVTWEDDPTADGIPDNLRRADSKKKELLDQIAKLSETDLDRFMADPDFYKRKSELSEADRRDVEIACFQRAKAVKTT